MKKTVMLKTVDLRKIKENASSNLCFLLYVVLFLIGLFISICIFYFDDSELVGHITNTSQIPHSAADVLDLLKSFCLTNMLAILIAFIFGFCAISKPILMINMICNATQIGLFCLQYTMQDSKNSLLFTVLVYIPAAVTASICVLIAHVQSSFLSTDIYDNVIRSVVKKINIRTYLSRYVLITFIMIFAILYLFFASLLFIHIIN